MQTVSRSLRQTGLLAECLHTSHSCRNSTILPHLWRPFSTTIPIATPLPMLDFLHPPIVHDAARRIARQERSYSKDRNSNEFVPSSEGWSPAELERQEVLFRRQEMEENQDEAVEQLFSELDALPTTTPTSTANSRQQHQPTLTASSDYVPHLTSPIAKTLFDYTEYGENPIPDSLLSTERQASLTAIREIIRTIDGKQQQVIEMYIQHNLENHLTWDDQVQFARYLYSSTHPRDLQALMTFFPDSWLYIPTLARLGRVDEAAHLVLKKFGTHRAFPKLVMLVIDMYAMAGDWKSLVSFWEDSVMSPASTSAIVAGGKYIALEDCLATIPNAKEWYISKVRRLLSVPNLPVKMHEYIKLLGSFLTVGLIQKKAGPASSALSLFRYQVLEFKEIDQNVLLKMMIGFRLQSQPKASVELYLSYRNNEFATLDYRRDGTSEFRRQMMMSIQNEAMASASMLNNFPLLHQMFNDIYALGLEPDAFSYSIVMHACARHGQVKNVQELFDEYKRRGRVPDVYIFAELLYAHVTLLDIPAVEKTFQMIVESGVDIGKVVYDMLVMAFSRTMDIDGAMRVFRAFIKAGHPPNVRIIGHLIAMFGNRGDTDAAVDMFNLLGEFGIPPDVASFNQLLNAYANAGDRVNAEAVIAKMREVGMKPDIVTWTTLMKLYIARKEMQPMVDVLARMRRGGMEPNEYAWAQVITAFAKMGGVFALRNARRVMTKMQGLGLTANVFHWNGVLEAAILATQDLLAMQKIYDDMLKAGVKPNHYTHLLLVSAYCKYGKEAGLEISEGILSRLTQMSQNIDLTATHSPRNTLSPALFGPIFRVQGPKLAPDQVQHVFDSYVNSAAAVGGSTSEPSLHMLIELLDVFRHHRDIEAVRRVWKAIKLHADRASRSFRSAIESSSTEFVVPGNRYILCRPFSAYIRALADYSELEEIDAVWDQLSAEGYDFDCLTWNTRIQICIAHKKHIVWAFRACEEVLMDGWEAKLKIERNKDSSAKIQRDRMAGKHLSQLVNRTIWSIEDDLMDLPPPENAGVSGLVAPELFPYQATLYQFIMLRRDLLLGSSIVDSSGRQRPGPEVWARLKEAFPRIVRAMYLHLKRLPKKQQHRIALDIERDENFKEVGKVRHERSRDEVEKKFDQISMGNRELLGRRSFL